MESRGGGGRERKDVSNEDGEGRGKKRERGSEKENLSSVTPRTHAAECLNPLLCSEFCKLLRRFYFLYATFCIKQKSVCKPKEFYPRGRKESLATIQEKWLYRDNYIILRVMILFWMSAS